MSENIEDLSIEYVEDGTLIIKQLDKKVLTKGAWSTIVYRYQELDRNKQEFSGDKYSIRRYQKRNGQYMQRSKFNISSKDQALKLIEILQEWTQLS